MQVLTTDVAIVGGGAAGCYAALNLNRTGVETIIVCKGLVGKSGASIFAGNLVLGGRLLGNTEDNARNTAEFLIKYHNQFLIDQSWARRCGQWIENVYYPELEEAGLYFRRDDDGNVVTSPGKIRSIAANVQGNSGVPFMDLRRKQIIRAKIPCLEETAVTALLRRPDGSVGGVFALDYHLPANTSSCSRAPSFWLPVTPTGCTRARPARAKCPATASRWPGASAHALANLEMQWWHTNDIADPPTWQRMQVYPNPMLGSEKSARMVNSEGKEFFNQQQDDPLAYGPYTVQLKALAKAGARRKRALRRRLFRRLRPLRRGARSTPTRPTARPSASSGCAFRKSWWKRRSRRITGRAASTSIRRPWRRRCPGFMSRAGSAGTATVSSGLRRTTARSWPTACSAHSTDLHACELPGAQVDGEQHRARAPACARGTMALLLPRSKRKSAP